MSVSDRQAELEDLETGVRVRVPLDEVEPIDPQPPEPDRFRRKTLS